MSNIEVAIFTQPDTFQYRGLAMPYDRVVGVSCRSELTEEYVGQEDLGKHEVSRLIAPAEFGQRLLELMRFKGTGVPLNCHEASSLLRGLPPYYEAPCTMVGVRQLIAGLKLGQLGVIGARAKNPYHSYVGLGEDTSKILQIMSNGGEIGIAEAATLYSFYQRIDPNEPQIMGAAPEIEASS